MQLGEGEFHHECVTPGCTTMVIFDDEPWCFTHSPDEGSSLLGYSARRAYEQINGERS